MTIYYSISLKLLKSIEQHKKQITWAQELLKKYRKKLTPAEKTLLDMEKRP